jgi:hypothetical protein
MNELWIEIPDTDGRYSISNLGSVRSNWSDIPQRNLSHRVRVEGVKLLKPWVHTTGYWRVGLGRSNQKYVHRLVAAAFVPNPDGLTQVDHVDGNRLNLSLENLRWVSPKQNVLLGGDRHKWEAQKLASTKRLLFVENAAEFSKLHSEGYSLRWIAKAFGTDHRLIRSRIDQFEAQSR